MLTMEFSEQGRTELFGAYVKAQADMGAVFKGANNPAFKSKYADLATVVDAVVPAFNKHGLVVIQSPSYDGEVVTVETVVAHTSGGFLRSALSIRPSKPDAHGIGSATTYARRYALLSLSGVAPEDDDGNAASGPQEPTQRFSRYEGGLSRMTSAQAKRENHHGIITQELAACQTEAALDAWYEGFDERTKTLPLSWLDAIRDEVEKRRNAILDAIADRVPV